MYGTIMMCMRENIGFVLVVVVIVVVGFVGWKMSVGFSTIHNGEDCGGGDSVKCPAGYACVNSNHKTITIPEVGKCEWQLWKPKL
jgi:hypothetical protein